MHVFVDCHGVMFRADAAHDDIVALFIADEVGRRGFARRICLILLLVLEGNNGHGQAGCYLLRLDPHEEIAHLLEIFKRAAGVFLARGRIHLEIR